MYFKTSADVDISKIYWAFWQKSYAYNIDNDFVVLFNCDTELVSAKGNPINQLGFVAHGNYKAFGEFSLYKTFKMSNNKYGINIGKPLQRISITSDKQDSTIDDFKQLGIYEVMAQYLLNKN